ncbi:MAG: hypothetical protein ACFE94_14780 [Candidatus Hodarchaeota archaeon]
MKSNIIFYGIASTIRHIMNSKEHVNAAIRFNNPVKVPVFNLIAGDILPLPITYSKN